MVSVYTTSFKEIETIKKYLSISYQNDYKIYLNKDNLLDDLLFDNLDLLIFDNYGDTDLIDTLLMMTQQIKSLKVLAPTIEVGQMYLSLTDKIQIQPKPLDIMTYLWDNPAFSLDNVIGAKENNMEVFNTRLKPIDYGDSFIAIKTSIDTTTNIDVISIEFNNLIDIEDLTEQEKETIKESVETIHNELPQESSEETVTIKERLSNTFNAVKIGLNELKEDFDTSTPNNVFAIPDGSDPNDSETQSNTVNSDNSETQFNATKLDSNLKSSLEYSPEKTQQYLAELDSLISRSSIAQSQSVQEPNEEISSSPNENIQAQSIQEPNEETATLNENAQEISAPNENVKESNEEISSSPKKKFNIFKLFGKKTKEEVVEEQPKTLKSLRRKQLVIYRTEIEYLLNECTKKDEIQATYDRYLMAINSGEKKKLAEMLLENNDITEMEYILFIRNFLKRPIFTKEELQKYEVSYEHYTVDNFKKLKFLELKTDDEYNLFVVSTKSTYTVDTLKQSHEDCRIILTLDNYIMDILRGDK